MTDNEATWWAQNQLMPTNIQPRQQQQQQPQSKICRDSPRRQQNNNRNDDAASSTSPSFGSIPTTESQETAYFTAYSKLVQVSPIPSSVRSLSSSRQSDWYSIQNSNNRNVPLQSYTQQERAAPAPELTRRDPIATTASNPEHNSSSTPSSLLLDPSAFRVGMEVAIVGGKHCGKRGIVLGSSPKRVNVRIFSVDGQYEAERHLAPTNLNLPLQQQEQKTSLSPSTLLLDTSEFQIGMEVDIVGGTHCDKRGIVIGLSPQRVHVRIFSADGEYEAERHLTPKNLRLPRQQQDQRHILLPQHHGTIRLLSLEETRESLSQQQQQQQPIPSLSPSGSSVVTKTSPIVTNVHSTQQEDEDEFVFQEMQQPSANTATPLLIPSASKDNQVTPRTTGQRRRTTTTNPAGRMISQQDNNTQQQRYHLTQQQPRKQPQAFKRQACIPPRMNTTNTSTNTNIHESQSSNPWAVPGAFTQDLHTELGLAIGAIQLEAPGSKTHRQATMAYRIFGDRLLHYEISLSGNKVVDEFRGSTFPPLSHTTSTSTANRVYELLCTDLKKEQGAMINGFRMPKMKMWIQYVLVSGPGFESINVQDELERICDFGSETPRKAAARIKMLNSTAFKSNLKGQDFMMFDHNISDFEE